MSGWKLFSTTDQLRTKMGDIEDIFCNCHRYTTSDEFWIGDHEPTCRLYEVIADKELIAKNARLRAENERLKDEIYKAHIKVEDSLETENARLTKAYAEALAENIELRVELVERENIVERLQAENERLKTRLAYAVDLMESLTPGGSEFSGDINYCAQWIADRLEGVVKQVKKRKEAEAENSYLKAANELDKLVAERTQYLEEVANYRRKIADQNNTIDRLTAELQRRVRIVGRMDY